MARRTACTRRAPRAAVLLLLFQIFGGTCVVRSFTPLGGANSYRRAALSTSSTVCRSSVVNTDDISLTAKQVGPTITIAGKDMNVFGAWVAAVSLVLMPVWALAMELSDAIAEKLNLDGDRAFFDNLGKIWANSFLKLTGCYPEKEGLENIAPRGSAVLYAANHASWLDIPLLCTAIQPVFKFIAKGELRPVPCIGKQLTGGHHILIDRDDRRSQLRTFKEGVGRLKSGIPLVAFPEGTRSPDGRLSDFKGGIFSMAQRAGVPVVPVTIVHAHSVMPARALFPFQHGAGKLAVHFHSPIDPEGLTDEELSSKVREAITSALPQCQMPLEKKEEPELVLSQP
eukprot:CAMPEP_0194267252 /NCGR_PEP_ID=MMETSP0169-20130528/1833_1 /TAXON_ID=218684 /ORGANISM="Corethron pennatum, Strain L29A3" /LENGTH=340 /DNA_ID=CAMNT_0039008065 /DNA_START=253 /DNA_END=1275 /DNA_ORIENTATION=-